MGPLMDLRLFFKTMAEKSADRSALHLQELTHQHKDEVSRNTGDNAADGVS